MNEHCLQMMQDFYWQGRLQGMNEHCLCEDLRLPTDAVYEISRHQKNAFQSCNTLMATPFHVACMQVLSPSFF